MEENVLISTINNLDELREYCDHVFSIMIDDENWNKKIVVDFLSRIKMPFTIVPETHHIDKFFRDTYYLYFSNQHFKVKRYSIRLSLFAGEITLLNLLSETAERLQECFVGSIVINPLLASPIGRTLIHPGYILNEGCFYLRLSTFKLHIYGRELKVRAFPYRMQDQETMRCGEVTILNIMEYFSNTYEDYRTVVPSDIISSELAHSHERVLPSNGMTYPALTKVLADLGFSPRLYNKSILMQNSLSYSDEAAMKRILYCYIESGFPVAVNLVPISNYGAGHSIVCIGHADEEDRLWNQAVRKKLIPYRKKMTGHALINSADLVERFVVIDDNTPGYCIRSYDSMSSDLKAMKVENIAVPLYKRMFLDAANANVLFEDILQDENYGLDEWGNEILDEGEDVVIRVFMASSISFKKYRIEHQTPVSSYVYAKIQMPRFVWVCELYRASIYKNGERNAFGEIIIDATSAPNRQDRSLILMRYGNQIAVRTPGCMKAGFEKIVVVSNEDKIVPYRGNLDMINNGTCVFAGVL